MKDDYEEIIHDDQIIAIIIRSAYHAEGIRFFTPKDFSQQLAYMNRPTGHRIAPHIHNIVLRNVKNTLEALLIRKGKVRIDFYTDQHQFITERIIETGDVIMLCAGGHGFTMLEPTEIIEVKQGPYSGDQDKVSFKDVSE
jgi:hypothetical protein